MPLQEYRKKREFTATPEPAGGRVRRKQPKKPSFVVKKHHATSPHYDFRLEIDGALVSWAIPRGPSLNPVDKRVAIMTEDHPLEYADFEGVIPAGNYGAGPVMIWDRGTYELSGDGSAREQLARGELKFALYGVKLLGEFALIHSASRARQWLLIKHRDEHADSSWDIESVALDRSVVSGRTLEEIAAAQEGKTRTAGG
jgi:bifunctional non-homologous end joining protein LigD